MRPASPSGRASSRAATSFLASRFLDLGAGPVSTSKIGGALFLVKLDAATGHPLARRLVLPTADDNENFFFDLSFDPDGGMVVVGQTSGGMDFGSATLSGGRFDHLDSGDSRIVLANLRN